MRAVGSRVKRMTVVGGCAAVSSALLLGLTMTVVREAWVLTACFGMAVGGTLAGFLTAFEAFWNEKPGSLLPGILRSALLGAVGGTVGAVTGQLLYRTWGTHLITDPGQAVAIPLSLGASLGWGLTGLGVGLAITLSQPSGRGRWLYASIGGTAGGLAGGIIMQLVRPFLGSGSLIPGLVILGAAVGLGISWTERLLSSISLQVLDGPGRGSEYVLSRNSVIGSHRDCSVRLTSAGVAPRHARITFQSNRPYLEDLGSPTAVTVNDRKVSGTSAGLTNGDLIRIGGSLLRVRTSGAAAGGAAALATVLFALSMALPGSVSAADNGTITQIDASRYPIVDVYAELPGQLRPGRMNGLSIAEDGSPATLLEVRDLAKASRDVPLTISLVVDTSQSMRGRKLREAREAIFSFTRTIPEEARVNLIAFNDKVQVLAGGLPPSLVYRYSVDLSASGHTALFDAIREGASLIDGASGRRAVITLTDGMANRGNVSMEEAVVFAEESGVSLLFVGLGSDARKNRLDTMAVRTGGKAVFTSDPGDLASLFSSYADDLSREVMIRYTSQEIGGDVVPVSLELQSGRSRIQLTGKYLSPRASFFGSAGASPYLLLLLGLLGPAGLFAASRLNAFNMGSRPFLLVEGSSQATRLLTKVLSSEGMTVPVSLGGETLKVNNQPVTGSRVLRGGETLTWGETTILYRKS